MDAEDHMERTSAVGDHLERTSAVVASECSKDGHRKQMKVPWYGSLSISCHSLAAHLQLTVSLLLHFHLHRMSAQSPVCAAVAVI